MKGYEGPEQINIFDLDILDKPNKNNRKQELLKRREKKKMALYHTLHISNILNKHCRGCEYSDTKYNDTKCAECPFYAELRKHSEGLMETTKDKIEKESWEPKRGEKDNTLERLYNYQSISELEESFEPKEIAAMREEMSLVDIAEHIDCDYSILKNYINKYGLNKREDGTYYERK